MKKLTQSKTVKVGTFYIGLGVLLAALQIFDQLEAIIASMVSTENAIGWGGVILAIMGGIQIWLRLITSQPIGNEPD